MQFGICASGGSACSSGDNSVSHVLTAIGVPSEYANGALRITFGDFNTKEDVDYLIDNLASSKEEKFMPEFSYVIVDEVDAVLLDTSTTPLVISGAPRVQSNIYKMVDEFVVSLTEDEDYRMDEEKNNVWLTKQGIDTAESYFRVDNLYDGKHVELVRHIALALKAHTLFLSSFS